MKFHDYINGERKGKNAHKFEHESMNDPFLSDAIDGYDSIASENHLHNIVSLQQRISLKGNKKQSHIWSLSIAAIILIAFLGGYFALMNHQSSMLQALDSKKTFLDLYIPDDYVQNKRLELTDSKMIKETKNNLLVAVVDIENLHDVISPVERLSLYIPGSYYAQSNLTEKKYKKGRELIDGKTQSEILQESEILLNTHVSDQKLAKEKLLTEGAYNYSTDENASFVERSVNSSIVKQLGSEDTEKRMSKKFKEDSLSIPVGGFEKYREYLKKT